jgi:hypothetical protein
MNFHHWVMLLLVVSMSIVHGLTSLSDGQYYNTTKELNLGGEWDWNTLKWITKECDVEGDLSSLKNMTQLEVLNLNWCDKVTGSLEDLEGLVNLRRLELSSVKGVEGSVSHLKNMQLTFLVLYSLSKAEGSVSHLKKMPLSFLSLAGTSATGTPSKSLISHCRNQPPNAFSPLLQKCAKPGRGS